MSDTRLETRAVLLAQSGDRAALDDLFRAVEAPLRRYILSLVGRADMAEDILQDVFVLIYRKLYWLREPALLRPWAYRVASREVVRQLKKSRRWPEQFADEAGADAFVAESPGEEFRPELRERLPEMLARVSPASRMVLVLHYLEEMALPEVGDVLGLPLGTVKSRLAYGLAALRKEVGKYDAAPP